MIKPSFLFTIVTLFLGMQNIVWGQNSSCSCLKDLQSLDDKIKKTTSYQNNKDSYHLAYANITEKAKGETQIYNCYLLLNKLLLSINDNHSRVYGIDKGLTDDLKIDSLKFDIFKNSKLFSSYPKTRHNLDSLVTVLSTKEKDEIEGIYSKNDILKIGVSKREGESFYEAVILESKTKIWIPGEIIYTLVPFGDNLMLSVGGAISTKRLISYSERIENGFFLFMGFQKDDAQVNNANELPTEETYGRKELSPSITYLRIGSFSGWNPTLGEAEKFYASLKGSLNKPNVIVDLRNNGGGGDRNSEILLKILKEYAKSNRIYLLTNHLTVSNAEQFTYKLSKLENCLVLGQRTQGTVAYELEGNNFNLPCGHFVAILSSKTHKEYLELESKGIQPDLVFDQSADWIDKTISYIERKTP